MSHQTGIQASDEARKVLAAAKEGHVRMLKLGIENEQLVVDHSEEVQGSWTDDYDSMILPVIDSQEPCFLFYRLDSKTNQSFDWIYISFVPDFAPVKQKMLYAATSASMKKEFGSGYIKEELFGSCVEDIKLAGYKKHVVANAAPAPLTSAEEEIKELKKNEDHAYISVDTKLQSMGGVAFPISREAMDRLNGIKDGNYTYVQLSIDVNAETINLEKAENIDVNSVSRLTPSDQGRYSVFNYKHTHEGDYMENIVFIYSIPGYKCPIKERMLYSSCKGSVIDVIEQRIGMEVVKKIEVDSPEELTEEFIYDEVHPKKNVARQQFARPKGPAGRGPKRIVRP